MNNRSRFTILGIIFFLFLILSLVAISFALGYRFDFSSKRFIATGMLMIRTEPKDADIYLNGKKIKEQSPVTIRFLLPGEYNVKLEKAGYRPWGKNFSIIAQQVTLASINNEKIALFLETPQLGLLDTQVQDIALAQNQLITWSATSTLNFKNHSTSKTIFTALSFPTQTFTKTEISPDANWAMVYQNDLPVNAVNLANGTVLELAKILPKIKTVRSFGPNELLLQAESGNLYSYRTDTGRLNLKRDSVDIFEADENHIYFVHDKELLAVNRASTTQQIIFKNLPDYKNGRLIVAPTGEFYGLFDKNLYQLGEITRLLGSNVDQAEWDPKLSGLIFSNSNNIWLYLSGSGESPELVARSSSDILDVQFNYETGQIFYLENNKVKAIEARAQTRRNIVELTIPSLKVTKFFANTAGDKLYCLTAGQGVYEIRIR